MTTALLLHEETTAAVQRYLDEPTQALLLTGAAGSGKRTLALEIGAKLLETSPGKLENHPSFRLIEPLDRSIPIATIRQLPVFLSRTAPGSLRTKRVVCIADSDMMTRESQNALLKLLEEPPERSVFILTAMRPGSLLPTVLSRLQRLHLRPLSEEAITQTYIQRGYRAEDVRRALLIAGNNINRLEAMLADKDNSDGTLVLVKTLLATESFVRLATIDRELKDKEAARAFIDTLSTAAASSLQYAAASNDATMVQRWQRILEASHVAQQSLTRNANQKLVLTELMLSL